MTASEFSKRIGLAAIFGAASLCAACSSMDNIMSPSLNAKPSTVAAAQESRVTDADKVVRLPLAPQDLDCPPVEVQDGGASLRVGGPENASVRYQFDIRDTARECDPVAGNQFSLKVGVTGHLLIGPAGKPGAYSAPLRLTVTDEINHKAVYSKSVKIDASTADTGEGNFQFVSDPIVLPMTRTELNLDYSVVVAFDNGRPAEAPRPRRRRPPADPAAH